MTCFTCHFLSLSFPRLFSCSPVFYLLISACLFKPVLFFPWLFASTSVFSCVPRFFPVFCQPLFFFFFLSFFSLHFLLFWDFGLLDLLFCTFAHSSSPVVLLPTCLWVCECWLQCLRHIKPFVLLQAFFPIFLPFYQMINLEKYLQPSLQKDLPCDTPLCLAANIMTRDWFDLVH